MAEVRQFEKFVPPWKRWVEQRRPIWSHVHLEGLFLGYGDGWICVSMGIVLAENDKCRSPSGIGALAEGEVCAFRIAVPFATLEALIEGMEVGEWPDGLIPGVPGKVRLNPVEGKRLEPTGDPRLESPNRGIDVVRPEARWPRFQLELQGPKLEEWVGQDRYQQLNSLDGRLAGSGKPGLSELASLFGILEGGGGHFSDIWNRPTTVRLIAPALCRIDRSFWSPEKSRYVASIALGEMILRDQAKVLLFDPHTLGLREPVQIEDNPSSPIEVDLGPDKPSDRAEVRLLFFGDVLQKERSGTGAISAAGLFYPIVGTGVDDRVSGEGVGDAASPGGWVRVRSLASGGQARVSLAKRDGQVGALKEILDSRQDPARRTRLLREIDLMRRFRDLPFLIPFVDSSAESDGVPYLVTEVAPFGSAEDRKGSFKGDIWRVLRLARDIASALDGLHAAEIIHRDIKPKNILLFSMDRAALADLGVAHDAGKTSVTTIVEPVDSGWFSPPEHARPGRPSPAYDAFMLGKTMYYLLTGGDKYRDHDFSLSEWSIAKIVGETAAQPLNALLAGLVDPEPTERLPSMRRVIRAIDDATVAVFGGANGAGRCTACGKAAYVSAGPLMLTQANLALNLPSGEQLHVGDRRITLLVCPECGGCAFRLADQDRRTLVGGSSK